jgi:hypothetical protein
MRRCSNANTVACMSCRDRAHFQSDDGEILYCTACAREVLEHEIYQAAAALRKLSTAANGLWVDGIGFLN